MSPYTDDNQSAPPLTNVSVNVLPKFINVRTAIAWRLGLGVLITTSALGFREYRFFIAVNIQYLIVWVITGGSSVRSNEILYLFVTVHQP